MARIKKPGYQDPTKKKTGLEAQKGAIFTPKKLPQNVLDAIAARRAKLQGPVKEVTQAPLQASTKRYAGSEDLSPKPQPSSFRQGLDTPLQQKYDFARDLYSKKFGTSLKPESLDYLAQRVVEQEQRARQPQDTLSPTEKAQFRAMGVTDFELRKLESGERTIDDIYASAERVQKQKEAEIQKQAQDRISAMRERTMAQYEPQFKEVERQRGISMSNVGRTAAAKGRAVSSVTGDEFENVTQSYNQQANAIRAERDARIALQEAQIQGASDEVIAGLSSQYSNARAQLMQSQAQNEALQAQALQAAQEFGDTTLMDLLSSIEEESNAQNDLNFDKSLTEAIGDGFAYGANGERLVNAAGQELTTSQQSFNNRYKRVGTQADAYSGQILAIYEDKATGQAYYEPMTALNRGATQPGYQPATSPGPNGFRTDRHRNPLAIITDVARQGGLEEGVDYTQGDPFLGKDKRTYYTANILTPDPMQTMVDVLDKIGFTTQSGGNRFGYQDGPKADAEWATLSNEQKLEVVAEQYMEKEKGSGVLLSDAMPSAPQPTMTEAQPTAVRSTPLTSLRDRKRMEAEIEREIQEVATPKEVSAFNKDQGKEDSVSSAVTLGKNIMTNQFIPMITFFDNNKDAITPFAQPLSEEKRSFNALKKQLVVDLNKLYKLGALAGPDFGILMESVVYPDNGLSFAVPPLDREIAFKNSVLNKMTKFYNTALENAIDLQEINTRFKDSKVFEVNSENLNKWAEALNKLELNVQSLIKNIDDPDRLQKNIDKINQIEIENLNQLENAS